MLVRKSYLEKIRPFIDKKLIKVLTGMRRCGKTTMLKLIIEELKNRGVDEKNIFFISFESTKYKHIRSSDELDKTVFNLIKNTRSKIYLLFDEIQNVNDWEISINSFLVDLDCDIYLTGSNANLLSGELATRIAGRYIEIKIYPFSFQEILECNNKTQINKYEKLDEFDKYMEYGGLPYLQVLDEGKSEYIQMVYDSIILKDIVRRYDIRDIDFLERLIDFLIENIGHLFSANSISKFMKHEKRKADPEKILRYIKLLQNAMIFSQVKREDIKGKQLLSVNEKYYLTDHGFYKALIGDNNYNIGQKLENIVYNELIRRGYQVTIGVLGDFEVDFICKKNKITRYIQVSDTIRDEKTLSRELNALLKINDNYPKYIITMDTVDYSQKGIEHINIVDFLTNNEI